MARPDRQKFIAGVVLVLFGLGFYMARRLDALGSEIIMLVIGAAFLAAYFYQKSYGLLVPGGILLGLGLGMLLQHRFWWANQGTTLGLGVGFLSIYVIARIYERDSHWWPLIPGTVLTLVGVPKTAEIWAFLKEYWPLILVAIGLLILIGAFRRQGEAQAPPARPAPPAEPPPPPAPEPEPESDGPVEPRVE